MARVTVENCLDKDEGMSHFDLVLIATERAKQISEGKKTEIIKKSQKPHVTALREIEKDSVDIKNLREAIVVRFSKVQNNSDDLLSNHEVENSILEEVQHFNFIPDETVEIHETDGGIIGGDEEEIIS